MLGTDVLVLGSTRPALPVLAGCAAAGSTSPAPPPLSAGAGAGDRPTPRPRFALFADGIFLSPAALDRFGVPPGGELRGAGRDRRVDAPGRGSLPGARPGRLLGVMDLGFAQWRLDRLGQLTRIDLKLAAGMTADSLSQAPAAAGRRDHRRAPTPDDARSRTCRAPTG